MNAPGMLLNEDEQLSDLDRHFARFIARLSGLGDAAVIAAATLASRATRNGDVCVHLADHAGRDVPGLGFSAPPLEAWIAGLRNSPAIGVPGDFRPLVLDHAGRLYLYRYWQYETALADDLVERAVNAEDVDIDLLRAGLGRLFPDPADFEQKCAAAMALLRRFCVISGGPGTGKTFTVVKILALLAEQAHGHPLAVALAAPTGKAAARVQGAVRRALESFPADEPLRAAMPAEAHTLHRLLGARPDSVYYRHDRTNPLALDVVVVDEASMADLALMAKLVAALPQRSRLIMLGDKDQLASVEAGAVLGDICAGSGLSPQFIARLESVMETPLAHTPNGADPRSPLGDSIALLNRSYRFGADSGIAELAARVNRGDGRAALDLLKSGAHRDLAWRPIMPVELKKALSASVVERLADYIRCVSGGTPQEVFERFNAFRVLCAHRTGPMGAMTVNGIIEAALEEKNLIDAQQVWYGGRPIMVTRNDYNVRLYNGDVGIALPDQDANGQLKVFFPGESGAMRRIAPARLPQHETVYAMTVHKSQGSEFAHVLMILPGEVSRVMSRELIYTGITRTREGIEIWGGESAFVQSVERRLTRASALRHRLWHTE